MSPNFALILSAPVCNGRTVKKEKTNGNDGKARQGTLCQMKKHTSQWARLSHHPRSSRFCHYDFSPLFSAFLCVSAVYFGVDAAPTHPRNSIYFNVTGNPQ